MSDYGRIDPRELDRFITRDDDTPERTCRVCGCTDDQACQPTPCYWIASDLCSQCENEDGTAEGDPVPRLPLSGRAPRDLRARDGYSVDTV